MTEIDIVKKVCNILEVSYHHHDNHDMPKDYFQYMLDHKPKIVAYSSKYSPWEFAILEDMSIITPTSQFFDTFKLCCESFKFSEDQKKKLNEILTQENKIKTAEIFLKNHDCSLIINNKKHD